MSWKSKEEENPLWRQYMDITNDDRWLKEINLDLNLNPSTCPKDKYVKDIPMLKSKTYATYSEDEFLEKLKVDEEFNKMWGTLK